MDLKSQYFNKWFMGNGSVKLTGLTMATVSIHLFETSDTGSADWS